MTAQELVITQELADAAASQSTAAWMLTGRHACYLLAEARPMPQQLGDLRFDPMLLRNRAEKARELAAAWSAVAEAWDEAALGQLRISARSRTQRRSLRCATWPVGLFRCRSNAKNKNRADTRLLLSGRHFRHGGGALSHLIVGFDCEYRQDD